MATENNLGRAASSYLRSARHQPIRWHEWGEEAFATAKRENKPILLDIGAVWCHWCHVMDRESYENPEVAEIINRNFIAVKVDRDERPDVDSRYQAAISSMTGQGGWPLTGFLTPDGKPFYGGTYFPPEDHWGRPGFKRVLLAIADAYRDKHGEVVEQAETVLRAVSHSETFAGRSGRVTAKIVQSMVDSAKQMFDPQHGGFGSAPKFPHPSVLELLTHTYARSGDPDLRHVVVTTLEKMARGGVYDQLGGGFHRYSVDERWVVPHFEKMSYDNSELLKNYVHGYQASGNPFFAAVARDIIRWMDEWLSDSEHGGFYASQDADISLEDDGDYFTWTVAEAQAVLSEDEWKAAAPYYDIGEVGEMHHDPARNVLYVRAPVEEVAVRTGMQSERISALLDSAKKKMCEARLKRPTPFVDKTVYTGWNALCVSAYLHAAAVLSLDGARRFALKSLDRVLSSAVAADGALKHVIAYADPEAAHRDVAGVLDDYAFTAIACLDAYEATADVSYFNFARRICDAMVQRFHDPTSGGFFDTETSGETLGALAARRKPFQDSPTPAGNSAAAIALLRLHSYTNEASYREVAEETLEVFAGVAEQFGIFGATYGIAATWLLQPHVQIIVLGTGEAADHLYAAAIAPFALNKVVVRLRELPGEGNLPPALQGTIGNVPAAKEARAVALVCSNFACRPPVSDPDELVRVVAESLARSQ